MEEGQLPSGPQCPLCPEGLATRVLGTQSPRYTPITILQHPQGTSITTPYRAVPVTPGRHPTCFRCSVPRAVYQITSLKPDGIEDVQDTNFVTAQPKSTNFQEDRQKENCFQHFQDTWRLSRNRSRNHTLEKATVAEKVPNFREADLSFTFALK